MIVVEPTDRIDLTNTDGCLLYRLKKNKRNFTQIKSNNFPNMKPIIHHNRHSQKKP